MPPPIDRARRLFPYLLVALAATVFIVRGPVRWLERGTDRRNDATGVYLAAKAWVQGFNPYTPAAYWAMADEAGWSFEEPYDGFQSRTPYPITTFVLLAPLTAFSWASARVVLMAVTVVTVLLAITGLATLPPLRRSSSRQTLFLVMALLLAPIHTGIGTGNLSALAVALSVAAVCLAMRGMSLLAGAGLGLALCFKPLVPMFALVYYALRRQWRIPIVAALVAGCIAAFGIIRLELAGVAWFVEYLHNNGILFVGHGGAIISGSSTAMQYINLQFLGLTLFGDARIANWSAVGIGAVLFVAWTLLVTRSGPTRVELLELGTLAVISLLPIYHRVYDAGLLLVVLGAVLSDSPRASVLRLLILLSFVPFLVPGVALLELGVESGTIPDWLYLQPWWKAIVVPHQVWTLLLMVVGLLVLQASARHRLRYVA